MYSGWPSLYFKTNSTKFNFAKVLE